jgi:hypothetical protein
LGTGTQAAKGERNDRKAGTIFIVPYQNREKNGRGAALAMTERTGMHFCIPYQG